MVSLKKSYSRRDFIKRASATSAAFMIVSPSVLGLEGSTPPSDRLNIAAIGAGGRAEENLNHSATENIVALCDVDDERASKMYNRFEKAKKYKDFRTMLDEQKEIDAIIVSTPDHTHAVATLDAIRRGKHVYVEKPLAHSIYEVRALMQAAREHKVITQLGNQGHSSNDIRKVCEWVWDGAIGPVYEVHAWYDGAYGDGKERPLETPSIPQSLDWDLWLGPAPHRPYHSAYVPGSWRSWADFGTGILGDWVCHVLDPTFWALKLEAPTSVIAENGGGYYSRERFPLKSTITYQFPDRGTMPPVKVVWHYGKDLNLSYQEVGDPSKQDRWRIGAILEGEKGSIKHGSHGGGGAHILPEARNAEYQKPPQTLPRVEGNHQQDWIRACKSGKSAGSNFEYGGPLTEVALLGVIACMFNGEKLEWDAEKARFTNNEQANYFIQPVFRQGWSFS